MTTQNLWDAVKTVLRGKFITIQSYLKKQEKHQMDNLTLHLKQLEKEEEQQQQQKIVVHGLESNPGSSLQTEEEAGLPWGRSGGSKRPAHTR